MTHITEDRQRLAELFAGESTATEDEVKSLAEAVDNARRRAGTKTLRDEFAMAAMTAIISRPGLKACVIVTEDAYKFADAMLEARK